MYDKRSCGNEYNYIFSGYANQQNKGQYQISYFNNESFDFVLKRSL